MPSGPLTLTALRCSKPSPALIPLIRTAQARPAVRWTIRCQERPRLRVLISFLRRRVEHSGLLVPRQGSRSSGLAQGSNKLYTEATAICVRRDPVWCGNHLLRLTPAELSNSDSQVKSLLNIEPTRAYPPLHRTRPTQFGWFVRYADECVEPRCCFTPVLICRSVCSCSRPMATSSLTPST